MYFAKNLKYLRRNNKLSQNFLADYLGYKNFTTIQKWEDGSSMPNAKVIDELATYFDIDIDTLLNKDIEKQDYIKIPILGNVKAGFDNYNDNDYQGFEFVDYHEINGKEAFYLRVKGDSMIGARIFEGDLVLVVKQNTLENDEIGLFLIDDDEFTIKRIKYTEDGCFLIAENDEIEDRFYKNNEQRVHIIGKVVHSKILF